MNTKFTSIHPKGNKLTFLKKILSRLILGFFILYAFILVYIQFFPAKSSLEKPVTVGVVLGAGITRNSTPSTALKMRLDKSIELYHHQKIKRFFISGRMAEVFVMKKYLKNHGVPKILIIEDQQGINTFHTIKNVKKFTHKNLLYEKVAFISQHYHLPRIALLVHKQGFKHARLVSADLRKIPPKKYIIILLREGLAMIKALIIDN